MIAAPKSTGIDARRELECSFAMHEQFEQLTDLARRMGWHWDEIALALLELTDEYVSTQRSGLPVGMNPRSEIATVKVRH